MASDRLPDIEYKTASDIEKGLNAVNAGLVGKSWAQNSASFTLAETRRPGQNGSTNMEGSIKLTPQRMKLCISAFEKIRTGTDGNDAGGEDSVSERNNRRRKLV